MSPKKSVHRAKEFEREANGVLERLYDGPHNPCSVGVKA